MKRQLFALIACTMLSVAGAYGQNPAVPPKPVIDEPEGLSAAHKYFTDVELINQNGQPLRFYSDLIKGRVVVISSFMATCNAACPVKNRNLEKLQEAAGARLGKDVLILSISVDPLTDTPARLKEYARLYHAKPGWHFLSGKKENVDWALSKVGQYVPNKEDHVNIVIMGNDATGLWKKAFGLAAIDELIKVFESVLNDKPAAPN
ncbi:MAG TPA: SCO family protein [Pyrinomonadaceae bacterium]|nr:SCO family protein [Pyrinomonadaceae bacterium]